MYLRARECVHVRANALNLCLGTAAASKYNLFRHLRLAPSIINQPTTSFHPPGRLAREIVEGGGGDPGGGKLSLESMEAEGKRFQQVLLDEEEELRRRIEFLHEVLDAEHQRDVLHSAVPTTNDLKDLRDKLQTELSFAAAEDKISNHVGAARLAPLGHSVGADRPGLSLSRPLSGSLSRGATPLCALSRPGSSLVCPASASSGCSDKASPLEMLQFDETSARPLSRAAASMGLDLDSDEDDFLFGGDDDDDKLSGSHPRSKVCQGSHGADVLVLDDDDTLQGDERCQGQRRSDSGDVALRNPAIGSVGGGREKAPEKESAEPVVDQELEEQSKALRSLLSGLVCRDTLADTRCAADISLSPNTDKIAADVGRCLVSDASEPAHRCADETQDGVKGAGSAVPGRRVRLSRHGSMIQQARSAAGDDGDAADAAMKHGSVAPVLGLKAMQGRDGADSSDASKTRSAAPRRAPLRAHPLPAANADSHGRALAAISAGAAPLEARGGLAVSGCTLTVNGTNRSRPPPLLTPPTPPSVPRRPPPSAGERMPRPVYARPSSSLRPAAGSRSTVIKPNEA